MHQPLRRQFHGRGALRLCALLAVMVTACTQTGPPTWRPGWLSAESMIVPRTGGSAVAANGYLYAIGGIQGGGIERGFVKSVEFARIQPDGSVAGWRFTSPLNVPRGFLKAVTANGIIYVLGGETFKDGLLLLNTVERAKILDDGNLGPWEYVASMNTPRRSPSVVVSHGAIYAMGGYNGLFLKSVERAALKPDGSLESWQWLPVELTTDRYIHGGALVGDQIYIVGGHVQDVGGGKSSTEWSRILPDGRLEPWKTTETIKTPRFLASTTAVGDYLFTLGGYQNHYLDSVERSQVRADGSLNPWQETTPLPQPKEGAALAVDYPGSFPVPGMTVNGASRRLYVLGGSANGDYSRDVAWAVVNEAGEVGYWATSPSPSGAPSS